MKTCSCGKQIEEKYDLCYDCYKKTESSQRGTNNENWIDLGKTLNIPLWAAIGIFIAGAVLGAWMF